MTTQGTRPPRIARNIRRFSALIIIGWVALTLLVTFGVPRLEIVGQQHSVPLAPQDAPAVQAMQRMGRDFKESDSDSFAMLVIEGQQQLGDSAHAYYDKLVRELKSDTKHIEHVQDLWGRPPHRGGCPESRRQGRLCAVEPGG